jgi:hypothetical protein
MRILRPAFGLQHDAGIKVDRAISLEARPFPLEDDVPGETAAEVFVDRVPDAPLNVAAESVANVDILAGNAQSHRGFQPSIACSG